MVRSSRALSALAVLPFLVRCGGEEKKDGCEPEPTPHDELAPTGAMQLSPPNPLCDAAPEPCEPKDEDPSLLATADGVFHVAWMSNRDGDDELYLTQSHDGASWSAPVRLTDDAEADWYPTLIEHQTATARFHLVWMRQHGAPDYARHVYYNNSADGVTWDPAREVQVTSGLVDDFAPYLVAHGGELLVYFDNRAGRSMSGTRDLFLTRSTDGASWTAPEPLDTLNSTTEMDTLPFVAPRPFSTQLMAIWVRYRGDATDVGSYVDPSSDLWFATSEDGRSWATPLPMNPQTANDDHVDTIGSIYTAGEEVFTWMAGVDNEPHVMEVPLSAVWNHTFEAGVVDVTGANGVPGWSPRAARTLQQGLYLRVWVSADKRVYSQLFSR
jgi:hypothetical protein